MMGGIDISTLTLEQYFRMIHENHALGMVNEERRRTMEKDTKDMTIVEYIKYETKIKRQSWRDSQSHFLTKYDSWDVASFHLEENKTLDYLYYTDNAKIDAYYDLPPLLPCFKHIQPYTQCKNKSYNAELDEEINYISYGESVMSKQGIIDNTDAPDVPNLEPHDEGISSDDDVDEYFNLYAMTDLGTCVNIMPNSDFEYLKLTNLKKIDILVGMANMTPQAPLGTVENVLVKIDKFVFPCDFVVIDMPRILGEMMILGKPFLATIHAQINVFNGEISFEIGEDRVKFDVNRNSHHSSATLENVYMATEKESFNPFEIEDDIFSYESPACL
ncbi:RNA-directed DNA polymerase, eukaryota, reverse transcriptase zinc-binding domain protein [Tanacetum coccineum]